MLFMCYKQAESIYELTFRVSGAEFHGFIVMNFPVPLKKKKKRKRNSVSLGFNFLLSATFADDAWHFEKQKSFLLSCCDSSSLEQRIAKVFCSLEPI